MTIGEVAKRAGVSIETVRYYQRRGLLVEPPRPARGFRKYPLATLQLLQFIRRAKGLGFSLREIQKLLALRQNRTAAPGQLVMLLVKKEQELAGKLRTLEVRQRALQRLVATCEKLGPSEQWRAFDLDTREE